MAARKFTHKPMTDLFTAGDTSIDRRQCRRIVPMKVLVLGLGRTGTSSIRVALKRLGYEDTYHMMSASVENPPDSLMWQQAFAAKYDGVGTFGKDDWDRLLGHCQAVCDWPAAIFGRELIMAYPEAKVIMTNRDVDSWYSSMMKTIHWRVTDPELRLASYVDWGAGLYYPMLRKLYDTFFQADFPGQGKTVFKEHYKEIRSLVPSENLLEYTIGDGWEPLCTFLEREIPLEPFPHLNEASNFISRCRTRNRKQLCNAAFRFLIIFWFLAAVTFTTNWIFGRFI